MQQIHTCSGISLPQFIVFLIRFPLKHLIGYLLFNAKEYIMAQKTFRFRVAFKLREKGDILRIVIIHSVTVYIPNVVYLM
jgi:hypothetical protein